MSYFNLQNSDQPANLTEKLALYMTNSLSSKLGLLCSIPTYGLSLDILKDCEMIVAQAYCAYLDPSTFLTPLWPASYQPVANQSIFLGPLSLTQTAYCRHRTSAPIGMNSTLKVHFLCFFLIMAEIFFHFKISRVLLSTAPAL